MKQWMNGRKKFVVLAIVLAVVLVAVAAIYIIADSFLGNIGQLEPHVTLSSEQLATIFDDGETVETDPVLEEAETIFKGNDVVNILLVGQDRRWGTEPERTDAMILCTINKSAKTLTMTSFMRDLWLYIPNHYNQRLNYPYQLGGFKLLNSTLEYNFGVSADYNVEIDFSGFMQAIDMVGGVEIELTAAEAKYLNKRGNWGVEDNTDWELKEGVNLLNGSQALAYSRIRKIGTDFGRTNRQRTVLTELVEKAKELDAKEMYDLAKEIMPLLRTDMSKAQIFGLILDVIPILSEIEVISQRIPMDGQYSYANKNGADVIVMSKSQQEVNKELIASAMKAE